MVERDLRGRGIRDERVLAAMARVPRHLFVLPEYRAAAYEDRPLPIGSGQTISQPYVVALMTEGLGLRGEEKVLEIGTGSGYQAAVLAEMGCEVYTIEIVESLAEAARKRLASLGYEKVHVRTGDGFYGWPEAAPFDAVILTAAAPRVPAPLVDQMKIGARIVFPRGRGDLQTLVRAVKGPQGLQLRAVGPVRFVPMVGAAQTPAN